MDSRMFYFYCWRILLLSIEVIFGILENQTTTVTMDTTILTVLNSKEWALRNDTVTTNYSAMTEGTDYTYLQENPTTQTTLQTFNSSYSDQHRTTQQASSLNDSIIFQFYSKSVTDVPMPKLYVGMKAEVSVVVVYPYGLYNTISIKVNQPKKDLVRPFFELLSINCQLGNAIKSGNDQELKEDTTYSSISRTSLLGIKHTSVNVSYSTNNEDRQELCVCSVFLQSTKDLTDGRNISLTAELEILTDTDHLNMERTVGFIAQTSVLERNKTAFCELNSTVQKQIKTTIGEIETLQIHCWIPFYLPNLIVYLSEESDYPDTLFSFMYMELHSFGSNFEPLRGVKPNFLWKICGNSTVIPTFFVNRGYYSSNETTDADLVVFIVQLSLSASAMIGSSYYLRVGVLLQHTEVWNSTLVLIPEQSLVNDTVSYTIALGKTSIGELLPSKKAVISVKITMSGKKSEIINFTISTQSQSNMSDPEICIVDIVVGKADDNMKCTNGISNDLNTYCNQTEVHLTLKATKIDDLPGTTSLSISVKVKDNIEHFGDKQMVVVTTDHYHVESEVQVNRPQVTNDVNGTISSELSRIVDGNLASCIRLPVQGDNPPLLQMKMNTAWLKIKSSAYNVTVIGENISCKPHGRKLLQVSYPITGSKGGGFHDHMAFCTLLFDGSDSDQKLIECGYLCPCTSKAECQELFIFMANDSETSTWKLCELKARNI